MASHLTPIELSLLITVAVACLIFGAIDLYHTYQQDKED